MSLSSLLGYFRRGRSKAGSLTVVIQSHIIYLLTDKMAAEHQPALPFPIDEDWEATLSHALAGGNYAGYEATVVCCSNYYHTYQLDKPEMPQAEWPAALPFLLKDISGERVTEIVADATPLPDGKKIQAYVLKMQTLKQLRAVLEPCGIGLSRVIPEDEVWGYVQPELPAFMLLHRGPQGSFKIAAFIEQQNRFQRTLRNIIVPVTNQAASALQMDSLALELQRSTDYLSSQLRNADLHQLYVCCDEEDLDELVKGLDERLNVKVLPLVADGSVSSGAMLSQVVRGQPGEGVNLYPPHLKPKKETFTLKTVVTAWSGLIVLMLAGYGYYAYSLAQTEAALAETVQQSRSLEAELKSLQARVKQRKPTPSKLLAAERIEEDIRSKEASLAAIHQYEASLQSGYSGVMAALAKLGRNDISVTSIEMDSRVLNLSGLARTPAAVPAWVKQFNSEVELTGRMFEKLDIGRNEHDVITFTLTAEVEGEQP